jgi:enamine deaminase RidA (YjgF/YER057c/UK114 family)
MSKLFSTLLLLNLAMLALIGCSNSETVKPNSTETTTQPATAETPEYYNLRPKLEKEYGYTHAVKIGNDLKISGAVSMNDSGMIVAPGNMEQQMKNCYSDLEKVLQHYGYTYDEVVAENIYTTSMADFIKVSGFRNAIYKKQFPTGTWLEVKGFAVEGQLIEIDMEAHKVK